MTHIATMGTSSCATIAIGGFKDGQKELNEQYKSDKKFTPVTTGPYKLSVSDFSSNILYPTQQNLGRTYDAPFTRIMEEVENSNLNSKLIIATLNEYQYKGNSKYWHKELLSHGFSLITKCSNNWGSINYVYIRNPSKVDIKEGEEK